MELASLGSTDLMVTPIGLGLAALGRPGYINLGHAEDLADRRSVAGLGRHAAVVLDAAYAAGVRYFDAARSYGRAEEFLAGWLASRDLVPGTVAVGSKWGYTYTADWHADAEVHEVKDHTLGTLERQWGESTALLGGHLGLYQIHSATESSGVLDRPDVLDRLRRLRAGGMALGLTTSGPDQARTIRRALGVEVDGLPLFQAVQATWNVLETSAGEALSEAHAAGLGVIVKEALANGRLTTRNPELPAALQHDGHSPDAIAIAAAVAQPWAGVVLSGAAAVDHLVSNLAALDVPAPTIASLPDLAEKSADYWGTRAALQWT